MKNGGIRKVFFSVAFLAAAAGLWASDHYKVANGPKDLYFGHISYIEPTPEGADPVVLRTGRTEPEQGVLNLPVGPGDTVRTSSDRRCEIQFDTGTIVRLDFATEVRVETILARSLSSLEALSVLTLERGRVYVMYKEYDRKEMFQVLTPNAAVKMKHNSVALVTAAPDGTTEAQVKYGRARVLFGPAEKSLDDRAVKKGERLIVLVDHQFELAPAIEDTAFELWNKEINAHFDALHEGLTTLPKPLQKLPPAVFYFAQTYGNLYGEWLWDDLFGYVWRPFIDNRAYPWGWSPYYAGRWSYAGGQMFWVPDEPWGWVPYHLGIWHWDKKRGWFWLPGSMFAPAWVTWDFYFGYACWRPWSLFDWMYDPSGWRSGFMFPGGGFYVPYWSDGPVTEGPTYWHVVRRDSLQQLRPASLPLPGEFKNLVKKVTTAYEKGDARIRDAAAAVPGHLVFVAKGDLASRAIHEKAMSLTEVAKGTTPAGSGEAPARRLADPGQEAARIFRGLSGPAAVPRRVVSPGTEPEARADATAAPDGRPETPGAAARRGLPEPVRFRDWNPDLRVARELGVRIEYSSARNEIRCPELRLSSRDRERSPAFSPRLTPRGVVNFGRATSVGDSSVGAVKPVGASASDASVSASPVPATAKAARTSSAAEKREAKGGEAEKIKK
jgi:hypothetical protein